MPRSKALNGDLHLKNHEYNVAVFVLYVPFVRRLLTTQARGTW